MPVRRVARGLRAYAGTLLFRFARTPLGGAAARFAFAHTPSLIPVARLYEDDDTLAFRHPRPMFPSHLLVVPKKRVPTLLDLLGAGHEHLTAAVLHAADRAAEAAGVSEPYTIVVNGGRRQDVRQVHFHVVASDELEGRASDDVFEGTKARRVVSEERSGDHGERLSRLLDEERRRLEEVDGYSILIRRRGPEEGFVCEMRLDP